MVKSKAGSDVPIPTLPADVTTKGVESLTSSLTTKASPFPFCVINNAASLVDASIITLLLTLKLLVNVLLL